MSEMGIRRVGTIVEGSRHPESTNHEDNIMRRTMKQCPRKIRAEHVVISLAMLASQLLQQRFACALRQI